MVENQSHIVEKHFSRNPRFTYTKVDPGGISGEVFIGGRDTQTGVKVAIKQPRSNDAKDMRERHALSIAREVKALTLLKGETGVCTLLDSDKEVDATDIITYAYLVTTFAEGCLLSQLSEEYRQPGASIPWTQVLTIIAQLTALLTRAHDLGIVHNDISLHHVFWNSDTGTLKLIDWGNVVFYREELDGARPAVDIRQTGELCYKLLTGNQPSVSETMPELDGIGTPVGLATVIRQALTGEYQDMYIFNRDIERLREGVKSDAQREWQILRDRVDLNNASHSDLVVFKSEIENSPHRLSFPQEEMKRWIERLDSKIHQLEDQGNWNIAKTYLRKAEYAQAIFLLDQLPPEYNTVNIELLNEFCQLAGQATEDMQPVILHLISSEETKAFNELLKLYLSQNGEASSALLEAIYMLARKCGIFAIWANLERLELVTERLADEFTTTRSIKGQLRGINAAVIKQIDSFKSLECRLADWLQAYQQVAALLERAEKDLLELDIRKLESEVEGKLEKLKKDIRWLHTGARQIENSLLRAEEAEKLGHYPQAAVYLEQACTWDPSNALLSKLLTIIQVQHTLADLNRQPAPQSFDDAEKLLEQYKEALQKTEQQPQLGQIIELEKHFYELERSGDLAKSFPPLHTFLKNMQARKGFSDCLQQAETLIQQRKMDDAREQLLSIRGMPEFSRSNGTSYLKVLELIREGFDAWAKGNYEDALRQLEKAVQTTSQSSISSYPTQRALEDWIKPFHDAARGFVDGFNRARGKVSIKSLPSPQDWQTLGEQLKKVYERLQEITRWNESSLKSVYQHLRLHQQFDEAYRNDPDRFVALVKRLETSYTSHPFGDIYKRWASNLRAANQLSTTPPSPNPVSTFLVSRLQEVEELILDADYRDNIPVALKRLRDIQSSEPTDFQKSIGRCYLDVLTTLNDGNVAINEGNYVTADSHFHQAYNLVRQDQSGNSEVWRKLDIIVRRQQNQTSQIIANLRNAISSTSGCESEASKEQWAVLETALSHVHNQLKTKASDDQLKRHQELYSRRKHSDFMQKLDDFEKRYPKHPYLTWYRTNRSKPLHQSQSGSLPQKMKEPPLNIIVVIAAILIVIMFISLTIWMMHFAAQEKPFEVSFTVSPTILAQSPTWTPYSTTVQPDELLRGYCQKVKGFVDLEQWDVALQTAEEAYKLCETDFSRIVQEIESQCDFRTLVAQAGIKSAQSLYDTGQYQQTATTADRAIAILNPLFPSDAIVDYRDLIIIRQCALYQQHISTNNPVESLVAWEVLLPYSNQPGFYNDFYNLCNLDYNQAALALTPAPTLSPFPCQPALPELIAPRARERYQTGSDVFFEWIDGQLCENQVWQVTINGQATFCPFVTEHEVWCNVQLPPGVYKWSVEIHSNGLVLSGMMTPGRSLIIIPSSVDSPGEIITPELTPTPN